MSNSVKIAVIGAGSWGTAIAILLSKNGHSVHLWGHNKEHVKTISLERENSKYLKGAKIPENIIISNSLKECVSGILNIVMVVPSHGLREVFVNLLPFVENGVRIISAVKGIENDTLMTMTRVMHQEITDYSSDLEFKIGVLSGPSFAEEVARDVPTAVTIGFDDIITAKEMQNIFGSEYFRVYASRDIIGLEISSSIKNIIAIATGVCDGLGYGLNTSAALITRGLAEMKRLGIALNAEPETFSGLSGIGDLLLTCTGNLSRNRKVGLKLGEGKKLNEIITEMSMVAEGVKTTKSVHGLAKSMGIEMPIMEQVYSILYENKECSLAVKDLLDRELKVE